MLDGLGTVEAYVARAKKLEMPALAMTDHGNVMGAPSFYTECKKNEIKPIIGEEFYFVPDAEKSKDDKVSERFHVGILAKNADGFRTLCELSTAAYGQFYYKPVLDRALLESLGDATRNLVLLTGCASGILARKLMGEAIDDELGVREELEWWHQIFPEMYVEIMHHGTEFDWKLNKKLLKTARKHDLPWVITNDPHYVKKNEHDHHDALLAIQTASDIDDPDRFRFQGDGYHLRSYKEMEKAFRQYTDDVWIPGAKNTMRIAKDIDIQIPEWDTRTWHIPKYPKAKSSKKLLKKLVCQELEARGLDTDERYVKQAKHELEKLLEVHMEDFLLITWDAIRYARRATKRHREIAKILGHPAKPMRVGPGRGSVAGTLVGYLIGIHKVDPIRYGLSFERFLNPERPKAPDVDTDYQKSRRDEMNEYYKYVYGDENVIAVGAYQTMQVRRCFQSLARAHGIHDSKLRNDLSKSIEEDEEGNAVLPEIIRDEFPELCESLEILTGVKASMSTHAAGLILIDPEDNIRNYVPRMYIPKRPGSPAKWVCQYNLASAEILSLFKQDNLALRTLDTIDECVRIINERHGIELDPDSWIPDEEPDDKQVYKMLADGKCEGVFQMEGKTNFRGIQEIKPKQFADIAVCTSLYRKGPMEAGAEKRFLENKRDRTVRVAHPSLEPYLKDTWGELIYQEQMFDILHEVAGFSWSRVDDAKTAMTKKDASKMAALKDEAIAGFRKNGGMKRSEAEAVWQMIAAQAGYLFNKCLTGDTIVYRSNFTNSSGQTISLEDLYRIWHEGPILNQKEKSLRSAYRRRGLSIKAYKDGAIKRAKIRNIHCNGVKSVWKITLANGMTIKSTGNHRHLSESGWKRTDSLLLGDQLVVDSGKYARPSIENKHARSGLGMGWASRPDTGRAIAADGRNRPSRGGHIAGLKAVTALLPEQCERCGETDGRLERAHLDGDRTNNSRENVLKLCNSCHKQHDWDTGQRVRQYEHGYIAETSEIVRIEDAGTEMTYDLEMDDPGHNFVANGIVTHNSHAVAYSLTTYQTARLKYLYPLEFFTALLRTVEPKNDEDKAKRLTYLNAALRMDIKVSPPDINLSDTSFVCDGKNKLLFGLKDIKGIGEKAVEKILRGRPKKGFPSLQKVNYAVNNAGVMKALSAVGALESLGVKPNLELQSDLLGGWQFDDPMLEFRKKYEDRAKFPKTDNGQVRLYGQITKCEKAKTKNGNDYMKWTLRWAPGEEFKITIWQDASELFDLRPGSIVRVSGRWNMNFQNVAVGDSDQVRVLKAVRRQVTV